jgi:hypothetical protein
LLLTLAKLDTHRGALQGGWDPAAAAAAAAAAVAVVVVVVVVVVVGVME